MQHPFKTVCVLIVLGITSCKVSQKTDTTDTSNQSKETIETTAAAMKEKGFLSGTLQKKEARYCGYILTVETHSSPMDPINIKDFFDAEIPEKVWVKYSNLRMKNRCKEARPVSITAIEKRLP